MLKRDNVSARMATRGDLVNIATSDISAIRTAKNVTVMLEALRIYQIMTSLIVMTLVNVHVKS